MQEVRSDIMRVGQMPRVRLVAGVALVMVAVLSVWLTHRSTPLPTATITGSDYAFAMPGSLPNGLVAITFKDAGKQPHQVNIARLNKGVTEAKFQQQLTANMDAALGMVTLVGGANTVDPGGSQQVVLNFSQGTYAAICFVTGPDGKPHFMDGMLKFFTVGAAGSNAPSAPSADATVTLSNFKFALPGNLKAGTYTWLVKNAGSQPHEMDVIKLASGKTEKDALAFIEQPSGKQPFTDAGGMGALTPGYSGWATMTLSKGTYVAICFVPDIHTGQPHFMEGMIAEFTVS